MTDLPKTRAEAVAAGTSKYFTGAPCKSGHLATRYTINSVCTDCHAERAARWRAKGTRSAASVPGSATDQLAIWNALVASKEVKHHRAHILLSHPSAAEFLRAVPRLLLERYPHLTDGRLPTMAPLRLAATGKEFQAVSYFAHDEDRERVLVGLIAETTR
jgi:hypothetical protein